jgi:hypothetical protein
VTSIGDWAFSCCAGLTSVEISDGVTSIGNNAFWGCPGLTSIIIPDSVASIGNNSFGWCSNLKTVYYEGTMEQWCNVVFANIEANPCYHGAALYIDGELVNDIVLPSTFTEIKDYAFSGCASLTSVEIPDGVTSIGESVFDRCTGLTSMKIPASVTNIDNYTLPTINLKTVYYDGTLEQWCNITFGKQYTSGCKDMTLYIDGELVDDIVIPSTVTEIKPYAFNNCISLTSVVIPDSVTSIGERAFHDCTGLTSVTIGSGVTSIDYYAFCWCSNLKTVYYEGSMEQWCNIAFANIEANPCHNGAALYIGGELANDIVLPSTFTEIKDYAFSGCTSLTSVEIPNSVTSIGNSAFKDCTGLVSIEIPASVTSIDHAAFKGCSRLTSIEIPDSVTSISNHAFYGCTGLASITFTGTVEQWNAITLGTNWKYNIPATTVTCSDGTVTL